MKSNAQTPARTGLLGFLKEITPYIQRNKIKLFFSHLITVGDVGLKK